MRANGEKGTFCGSAKIKRDGGQKTEMKEEEKTKPQLVSAPADASRAGSYVLTEGRIISGQLSSPSFAAE